jgi:hypothetical protein
MVRKLLNKINAYLQDTEVGLSFSEMLSDVVANEIGN